MRKTLKVLCLVTVSMFSTNGFSTDTIEVSSVNVLDEVVITYQAFKKTPITFQNVLIDDIKQKIIGQEPSFILSSTPSVSNYSDGGGFIGYSYFRLRGIDQTRINVTLDGIPLNEPEDQGVYFSNHTDILESVSKIQIQRGVSTTKNGNSSYGGSIELFSPNLTDSAKTTISLGYGSYNTFRVFSSYNSGIIKNKGINIRASQVYSDGYKNHSNNNSQSIFISGLLFGKKTVWKLNFLVGHQRNQMAWLGVSDSMININPKTNSNTIKEKDRFVQNINQVQNSWEINNRSFLQSSLYYTHLNGNYDFDLNNFLGLPSDDELYNYALKSHLMGGFINHTITTNRFDLTSGVHTNTYSRRHVGSEKTMGELYLNTGYKNDVSIFSKINYRTQYLSFFGDVQYRYVDFNYVGAAPFNKLRWNFINPKFGVSAEINNNYVLYYSIGYSGREPTRNDMFGGEDDLLIDSTGIPILYNTNPEFVLNHELGFRLYSNKIQLFSNLYYMDFKNEIVLNGNFGPNGIALTNNVNRSFRSGIELGFIYKVTDWVVLSNNTSFNYSRIKDQGEVFSPILTPPIIVNQDIIITRNAFRVELNGKYQHRGWIDFANENKVNSYFTVNTILSYIKNKYDISLHINNVTNSRYFSSGYVDFDGTPKYFVQAPINFYGRINFKF